MFIHAAFNPFLRLFIIGLLVMCPVNIHLFWVAIEALEKSVKYVQS